MLQDLYSESDVKIPLQDFDQWEYYHVAKLFKYDFNISKTIKLNEISGSELLSYTKDEISEKFNLNKASLVIFLSIHKSLCDQIRSKFDNDISLSNYDDQNREIDCKIPVSHLNSPNLNQQVQHEITEDDSVRIQSQDSGKMAILNSKKYVITSSNESNQYIDSMTKEDTHHIDNDTDVESRVGFDISKTTTIDSHIDLKCEESISEIKNIEKTIKRSRSVKTKKSQKPPKRKPKMVRFSIKPKQKKIKLNYGTIPCISYTGPREDNIIHDIQYASISYTLGSKYFDFIPWPSSDCIISHLVVSKLQKKPTLKILYALANKSHILSPDYVYDAIKYGNWQSEENYEHSNWPKLKDRNRVKLPLKETKFYLISNLKKIGISDASIIIGKLGGRLAKTPQESTHILSGTNLSHEQYATYSGKFILENDLIETISSWNGKKFDELINLKDKVKNNQSNNGNVKEEKSKVKSGDKKNGKIQSGSTIRSFSNKNDVFYDTPLYSDDEIGDFLVDDVF